MADDLGFDPTPSIDTTWEQYFQIAEWFNKNAKDDVPYGTGHQAKQHDSLHDDFCNVLWAYGGDYFDNGKAARHAGHARSPARAALDQRRGDRGAPSSTTGCSASPTRARDLGLGRRGRAFQSGQIAMCPNWHEFAAGNEKALPGKVGYAPLPKGPARSANIWGGTGIGINANCSEAERGAAWLFVNWATSPDTQFMHLASEVGGGTPTRTSVYQRPEVEEAKKRPSKLPNILTADAVNEAWKQENIGLRPKVATWNELDTALFTELSRMIAGEVKPDAAMRNVARKFDEINKV